MMKYMYFGNKNFPIKGICIGQREATRSVGIGQFTIAVSDDLKIY